MARSAAQEITHQEIIILNYLQRSVPSLPVPPVFAHDADPANPISSPFMIQSRLPGITLSAMSYDKDLWPQFNLV